MDSQKCREKLEKMARQAKCLIESPYANGDPSGAVREELDVLSFALTVLDEWEKMKEYREDVLDASCRVANKQDAKIASLESDLARMKGFMEKIRAYARENDLDKVYILSDQALRLGETGLMKEIKDLVEGLKRIDPKEWDLENKKNIAYNQAINDVLAIFKQVADGK